MSYAAAVSIGTCATDIGRSGPPSILWPVSVELGLISLKSTSPQVQVAKHRMNSVSLVGTVHDEFGRANVSELRAILERIRPEVIFLEVPLAAFDDYYV